MPMVPFETLPDASRLWVFGVERALTEAEQEDFLSAVDRFLDTWMAHGFPLTSGRDWRWERFLLVAVDQASEPPSGCSIDAMVGVLRDHERRFGVRILDNTPVWFVGDDEVKRVSRAEFGRLAQEGAVGPDTVVFDNTVTSLRDARSGRWQGPARASWHQKAFFKHTEQREPA
jgi:hypothetical protein